MTRLGICAFFIFLGPLLAQPSYMVGTGAGFDSTSSPKATANTFFAKRLFDKTYATGALESSISVNRQFKTNGQPFFTAGVTKFKAGFMQILATQGNYSLVALGTAGFAAGNETVGSAFDGGGGLHYNIKDSILLAFHLTFDKTSQTNVQPALCFLFLKTFN